MNTWDRFFFEPRTTANAALLRIGFGVLAVLWAFTYLPDVDPFLTDGALRYDRPLPTGSWGILEHIGWDGAPLLVLVALMVAGVTTTIGLRSQLSAFVAFLALLLIQRHQPIVNNSGDFVVRHLGLIVALSPCGYLLGLDARRRRRRHPEATPPLRPIWALRFLQLGLCVGYFASGWAKAMGETWHEGTAIGFALRIEDLDRFRVPEWFFDQLVLINLVTWATLAFELGFAFLVWNRRLRPFVLGFGVAFHVGIDLFLDVGFFSPAMILAYVAFLPPEVADRWVAWLSGILSPRRGAGDPATPAAPPSPADRAGAGAPLP